MNQKKNVLEFYIFHPCAVTNKHITSKLTCQLEEAKGSKELLLTYVQLRKSPIYQNPKIPNFQLSKILNFQIAMRSTSYARHIFTNNLEPLSCWHSGKRNSGSSCKRNPHSNKLIDQNQLPTHKLLIH